MGRQGSARDARSAVRVPRQRFGALMRSLLHVLEHDSFRRSGGNSVQGVARKTQPSYGQHQACLTYSVASFPIRQPRRRTTVPRRLEATPEAKNKKVAKAPRFLFPQLKTAVMNEPRQPIGPWQAHDSAALARGWAVLCPPMGSIGSMAGRR